MLLLQALEVTQNEELRRGLHSLVDTFYPGSGTIHMDRMDSNEVRLFVVVVTVVVVIMFG